MKNVNYITRSAAIAALYVALTLVANMFGLASSAIQVRISEALTVLPYFTPCAIPGLFIGCIFANLFTSAALYDVIFGSLATLVGALGTYALRKRSKYLAPIPPIVANIAVVPLVLIKVYGIPDAWWYLALTVGAGEVISCGILGTLLMKALERRGDSFLK